MPRLGITLDEVLLAADQIQSEGSTPTIEKIRQIVGAGSNTTISKYFNTWKEQTFSNKTNNNIKSASSDLVKLAAEKVWQQINEEANTEIQTIKIEAQKIIEDHEKVREDAENQLQKINGEKEKIQQEYCGLQALIEIQKLDYKRLKEEYDLLQERYKGLDARFVDLHTLTTKHQEEISIIHRNEINNLIEKSKDNGITYQRLVDEIKLKMEEQRHQYVLTIDSLKIEHKNLIKKVEEQNELCLKKDITITDLNVKLNSALKERDAQLAQLNNQELKWNLLEKNNALTKNIFHEIKNSTKFDLVYLDVYQSVQINLNDYFEKLNTVTNKATETLKYLLKEKEILNAND